MPGTGVAFEIEAGVVHLVKPNKGTGRTRSGQKLSESLRACGDLGMNTDEVVALMPGPAAHER